MISTIYLTITIIMFAIPMITAEDKKSNILFVIVDDLRPALGCYGDTRAHTPSIDRLAQQSILFDKAYAQQALCAPSRNSLLTSRRPDTLGLYDFYSYWRKVAGNFTTLPQHLKNNGYTTMSVGKVFHPGASCNKSDDSPYSWSDKPFHPSTEHYKDAPLCTTRYSLPASNLVISNIEKPIVILFVFYFSFGQYLSFLRVSSMPNETLPDIETLQAAKKFLNANRQKPFFLAVGFQKPHIPLKYPKRYLKFHPLKKFTLPINYEWPRNVSSVAYNPWTDLRRRSDVEKLELKCPWEKIPEKFAKKIIQSYYAAVTYIDDLIGKLIKELQILRIRNNTIIVLTSDHGWSLGEHAEWAKYSNFEVAARVPLIISIPNVTFNLFNDEKIMNKDEYLNISKRCSDPIKTIRHPVELLDVFPTLAEIANAPVPKCPRKTLNIMPDLCSEGSSLVPLIEAALMCKSISWTKSAISQYPRPGMKPTCIPSSDEPRLREITIMGYTLRTIKFRYTAWVKFSHETKKPDWRNILAEELYDHESDPEENFNLIGLKNFQKIKNKLKNELIKTY